jgi:Polycystin cation channel
MYRKLQGINAIILVCGIFPYFSFSLKLSVVLHVARLAKREISSYVVIFLIIIFGYGIGGYMIYGDKMHKFGNPLRASLEILVMTIGGVSYDTMSLADPDVTPVFVFSYLIAAYIIFLKMIIVILEATYRDLNKFVEQVDISFIAYLIKMGKMFLEKMDSYIDEQY